MNWDALGAVAELVGAIAVVATLTYLAVQIRTTRLGEASAATYSAMEGFSRWRSNILQNPQVAEALNRANNAQELSEQDQIYLRTIADELFILVGVGATESEKWGPLDRDSIDFQYLRLMFQENPGLVDFWQRYRSVGSAVSSDYVSAVDDLVTEIQDD